MSSRSKNNDEGESESDDHRANNGEAVSSYSPGLPQRSEGYPGYRNNNTPNLEEVASPRNFSTRGNLSARHFLVLALAIITALAAPATRASEKWLRLTSEHFDMLSCTSERSSRQMLVQLEQFRAFFLKHFSNARVYDPRPLILVFDTDRQYTPYKPRTPDGKERPSQGLFMSGPFLPRIMMVNGNLSQGLSTIFHEYVHSLVSARMGDRTPPWFNEGLASVFQTFDVSGDKVTFGAPIPAYIYLLANEHLIPPGTLFAVDGNSKYYNEQYQMNIFYSEAWLLMHYAMCGEKHGAFNFGNMLRFVDATMRPGAVTPELFSRIFGSNYEKLEEALDDYRSAGSFRSGGVTIPAKPIKDTITSRPATAEERDIELAGARWRSNGAPETGSILRDLAKKYPDNPRVHEILAEMKMSDRESREAQDCMREAVAKKSTSPMVYIWLLRNYYMESDLPLGYIMPPAMETEYTTLVDRALELAPDCMEAYEMLAIIESQRANMRIKKLNEALKAAPEMIDPGKTYLAASVIYWRLKKYPLAEPVLNELLRNPKYPYWLKWRARDLLAPSNKGTGAPPPPPPPPPTPLPPQPPQNRLNLKLPAIGK